MRRERRAPGTVVMVQQRDGSCKVIKDAIVMNGKAYFATRGINTYLIVDKTVPFNDVPSSSPFYNAVEFAAARGIMNGISQNVFDLGGLVTRGMFARVIYNLYEDPAVTGTNSFSISPEAYCYDAVQFCYENKIMTGYDETDFGADNPITREQIATVLWRMSGSPTVNYSLNQWPDADEIGQYAVSAMKWAVSKGLIQGTDEGELQPTATAQRYQIALLMQRLITSIY